MYSVILADDEEDIRQAIIEKTDWETLGFKVIGDAGNGVEALELVEKLSPDLLITDIKMPLMTGLTLSQKVREICPGTQIVMLSGYDDFEYARAAINFNTISYILKPISSEEFTEEMVKVKAEMDRRLNSMRGIKELDLKSIEKRLNITSFLLPLFLGNAEDSPSEEMLLKKALSVGLLKDESIKYFGVVITKFKDKDNKSCTREEHASFVNTVLLKYVNCESFFVNGRIATFIMLDHSGFEDEMDLPLRELNQDTASVFKEKCTIGVSREVTKLSQCGSAYLEALTARRYTKDGAGSIRFINDQEHGDGSEFDYIEKTVYKLEMLLKVGKPEELVEFLNSLYTSENYKSLGYLVIQIPATVYRAVSAISDKKVLSDLVEKNPIFKKTSLFDYEDNIKSDLNKLCKSAQEIISHSRKRDTDLLCDKVLNIIDTEFENEELSLADVSARLNVSPNYLSTLIKKVKKTNFSTLLTERRMKASYDMLICTNAKILDIANNCGYGDQHYFSYCFKKYYGVSPNKMRETGRGE